MNLDATTVRTTVGDDEEAVDGEVGSPDLWAMLKEEEEAYLEQNGYVGYMSRALQSTCVGLSIAVDVRH